MAEERDDLGLDPRIDRLIDGVEDGMENARHRAGIDDKLTRLARLSAEQVAALEWHQIYSTDLSRDQQAHLRSAIERLIICFHVQHGLTTTLNESIKARRRPERSGRLGLGVILVVVLTLLAAFGFRGSGFAVDPYGPTVFSVKSTWWGLHETRREIAWKHERGYDAPDWMTRDTQGDWYPYFVEAWDY